jgi:hypothetical protein
VEESGQEDFAALKALFRWLKGREHHIEIYNGLKRFFENEVYEKCR